MKHFKLFLAIYDTESQYRLGMVLEADTDRIWLCWVYRVSS